MTEQFEPDEAQDRAVELLCKARMCIVTGPPGSGKTSVLRRALDSLDPRLQVALAAPTGKAAVRMQQATGRPARTIHRLLEWRGYFTRDHNAPLDADLVIIDEASMIDVELAAALFDAIGPKTRIALVGDVDQLPPVGPGEPFAQLIESGDIPTVRLGTLHRAALASWVNRNAPRVLKGGPLELDTIKDFEYQRCAAASEVLGHVQRLVDGSPDVQLLIPQKNGPAGIDAANTVLQGIFNPSAASDDPSLQREKFCIREGDKVIQTRNDYDLQVFNGEIGMVESIRGGLTRVNYVDEVNKLTRTVEYNFEKTNALQLAYALTVHRSQGSQFERVCVVAHSSHTRMLNRKLFYTAITRTRGSVTLVGDDLGLEAALNAGRVPKRNDTLVERMHGVIDEVIDDSERAAP